MKLSVIHIILTTQSILCVFAQENMQFDTICIENRIRSEQNFIISVENMLKPLKNDLSKKTYNAVRSNMNIFKEDFINQVKAGDFICEPKIVTYVNRVFSQITKANSIGANSLQLLVSKNNSLNAFCLPDGTFIIHLGLFYWLENEDQLASVLSHELAHYILKHSIHSQVKYLEDKNRNKKIKEITRFSLGRRERVLDLYKEILYSQGEDSRNHEYQADSLGYLLYKNTKYNIHEYLSAMTKLEEQNTIEMDSLKLETLFHYLGTRGVSLEQYLQSFQMTYSQNYYRDNYNIESKLSL